MEPMIIVFVVTFCWLLGAIGFRIAREDNDVGLSFPTAALVWPILLCVLVGHFTASYFIALDKSTEVPQKQSKAPASR